MRGGVLLHRVPVWHTLLVARKRIAIPAAVALLFDEGRDIAIHRPQHRKHEMIRRPSRRGPQDEREAEVDRLPHPFKQAAAGEGLVNWLLIPPHTAPAENADLRVEPGIAHGLRQQQPAHDIGRGEPVFHPAIRRGPQHLRGRPKEKHQQQLDRGQRGKNRRRERFAEATRRELRHETPSWIGKQPRVPERELREQREIDHPGLHAMQMHPTGAETAIQRHKHHHHRRGKQRV